MLASEVGSLSHRHAHDSRAAAAPKREPQVPFAKMLPEADESASPPAAAGDTARGRPQTAVEDDNAPAKKPEQPAAPAKTAAKSGTNDQPAREQDAPQRSTPVVAVADADQIEQPADSSGTDTPDADAPDQAAAPALPEAPVAPPPVAAVVAPPAPLAPTDAAPASGTENDPAVSQTIATPRGAQFVATAATADLPAPAPGDAAQASSDATQAATEKPAGASSLSSSLSSRLAWAADAPDLKNRLRAVPAGSDGAKDKSAPAKDGDTKSTADADAAQAPEDPFAAAKASDSHRVARAEQDAKANEIAPGKNAPARANADDAALAVKSNDANAAANTQSPTPSVAATPAHGVQQANVIAAAAPALAAAQPPAVPLAGLALEIAGQARAGKSRFEIRLDPPELGRIDVRLDVDRDGNVTSRLTVERAETLDLLRRDAHHLERALQDAGLKNSGNSLEFSLRDQSQKQQQADGGQNRVVIAEDDPAPIEALRRGYGRMLGLGRGLDIQV